ncbi:MAG: hypothetical protein U0W40_11810 [Acidimicrobiia bacterium]
MNAIATAAEHAGHEGPAEIAHVQRARRGSQTASPAPVATTYTHSA